jgi:hypothetical protein
LSHDAAGEIKHKRAGTRAPGPHSRASREFREAGKSRAISDSFRLHCKVVYDVRGHSARGDTGLGVYQAGPDNIPPVGPAYEM